ncbi:MAG TPA: hypothetical protein VFW01_02135 [bacterium]|nr:hypothetical protein [bacterium]
MRVPWLLAWRSLSDRPWRSALLLLGYGAGVAVMVALLSVGDALLSEARDRDLVAGGDLVLLPQGVDPAVLKVNGVTGLFFTIPHAAFIVRDVLGGPRFAQEVAAAAPQIFGRLVYVRVRGKIVPATASAGIPSLDQAAHAAPAVPGAEDGPADRAWLDPAPGDLLNSLDHFHTPPPGEAGPWAEWDYFTFLDPHSGVYGYLTLLAGGEGRGAVLIRLRRPGQEVEDLAIPARIRSGDLSVSTASQHIGPARVTIEAGQYHVTVWDRRAGVDVRLVPEAGFYLPPGEVDESAIISGYVVPVVRGWMTGTVRTARTSLDLVRVPAYHDHNWGTWRGVTWEWGEASGPDGAVLYGALHTSREKGVEAAGRPPVLFLWASPAAHRGGFEGIFPVRSVTYTRWHPGPRLAGRTIPAPGEVTIAAGDEPDAVRVRVRIRDALASPAPAQAAAGARPAQVFLQLRGDAEVRGTVDGRPFAWTGPAASETFVPFPP